MTAVREVYLCPHCYMEHDSSEEATECCAIEPIHRYQCVQCAELWKVKENAKECCT